MGISLDYASAFKAAGWVLLGAVFWLILFGIFVLALAQAREQYPGQYAQSDPETREWFNQQKVPKGDGTPGDSFAPSCCSAADGVYAEEDIRGDDRWVRFVVFWNVNGKEYTIEVDWMPVPASAIIPPPYDPRFGQPVVWWTATWEDSRTGVIKRDDNGKPMVSIRCYKPGTLF